MIKPHRVSSLPLVHNSTYQWLIGPLVTIFPLKVIHQFYKLLSSPSKQYSLWPLLWPTLCSSWLASIDSRLQLTHHVLGQGSLAQLAEGGRHLPGHKKKSIGHGIPIWYLPYDLGHSHLNFEKKCLFRPAKSYIFLKRNKTFIPQHKN